MRSLLALGFLLSFVGAPAAQDPNPPPNQMDPGELEKAIGKAIDNGVAWLKKQQKNDGSWGDSSGPTYGPGQAYHNRPGIAALALLALLKSDVEPRDPVIQKGFKCIYDYAGQKGNLISNYDMGVILMAIESLYEAMVKEKMKKEGKKTTERPGDFKEPKYSLSPGDVNFCGDLIKRICDNQTKEGGWRYGKGFGIVGSDEDMSATQIVLLGLKSATRMKLMVSPDAVKKAMDFVLRSQDKDGPKVERPSDAKPGDRGTYASLGEDRARGWAYEKKSDKKEETTVDGSMTCAGITTLLIAKSIIGKMMNKKENERIDQCIWDGFAWLYTNWSMTENPKAGRNRGYYYLYGVERVATLGCYEKIGKHYWYKEGAEKLVKDQQSDGHWDQKDDIAPCDIIDTCLALLFLKRGTVPIGDVMTPRTGSK